MYCNSIIYWLLLLQVTLQGCDIDEARLLYDQLSNMCPIMVRLLAAIITMMSLVN